MVAARIAHLESQGQSAFKAYQLPNATLMLRQGFGRLIRRTTDRGMVAILDDRIRTKGYGKAFLRGLPECPQLDNLESALEYLRANR